MAYETRFTKGPWESKPSPFEVYNVDHGALFGHLVAGHTMIAAFYDGHNTPDAHLIAAAPDLYEAVMCLMTCEDEHHVIQAHNIAKAALEKAQGK